jgi:Tfp pilus assembly protein PilW
MEGTMRIMSDHGTRRGVSLVQVAMVLGLITVISVASFFALGTTASQALNTTATNAGDPSTLVSRFSH